MARVGIDLDGVCFDFNANLAEYLNALPDRGGAKNTDPSKRWEFYLDWGLTLEEFLAHCHDAANLGILFRHGPVINDAKNQIDRLIAAGHRIVIITDRSFGKNDISQENTVSWLTMNGIRYDELHFTAEKHKIRVDYMIDDKPQNYNAMRICGVDVWLLDAPWNQNFVAQQRINTVSAYVDHIVALEGLKHLERKAIASGISFGAGGGGQTVVAGETRAISSTGGQKGTKLARFDLIPEDVMWELAELYGKGAEKYEPRNWERGYDYSLSYAAARRHMSLFWQGFEYDEHESDCPEGCKNHTGKHHLVCAMFHLIALRKFCETHPEFDDRPQR